MVNDIAVARFNRSDRTDEVSPCDALHAALADVDVQEASHVFIIYGKVTDEGVASGWLQGGTFDPYTQIGMIERVKLRLISEMQ